MLKVLLSAAVVAFGLAGFAGTGAAAVAPDRVGSPFGASVPSGEMAQPLSRSEAKNAGEIKLAASGRRRAFGAGIAVGVIGSLIAQGVAESRAREIRDDEWRWEKCDRRFRSFEWDTGMYTTYGGERRLCPYLR